MLSFARAVVGVDQLYAFFVQIGIQNLLPSRDTVRGQVIALPYEDVHENFSTK